MSYYGLSLFYFLTHSIKLSYSGIPEVLLYERHELIFVMGSYLIKSGEVAEGRNLIEGCLETLRTLGAEKLLLAKESEYQELLNSTI